MMIPRFELTACAVVASEGMQRHTHPPRMGATETNTTCDTQADATHHRRVRTLVDSLKRNGVPNWGPGQFSSVASPALLRLLRGIARWGLGDRLEGGTGWGQVDRSADVRDLCADGLPGLYPWRYGGCGRLQPRVHEDADWLAAALTVAASTGETGIVRYLCELPADRGVDPAAHLNDAIVAAAWFGHVQVVRSLCELPRGSASVLYTSLCPVWRAATRVGWVSARGKATADDIPVACLWSRMALVGSKIAACNFT